jgi:hypothetical protein
MIRLNDASENYFPLLLGVVGVLEAGEGSGGVVVDDASERCCERSTLRREEEDFERSGKHTELWQSESLFCVESGLCASNWAEARRIEYESTRPRSGGEGNRMIVRSLTLREKIHHRAIS